MHLRSALILLITASAAAAQPLGGHFLQNSDVSLLFGLTTVPSHTLSNPAITVRGATTGTGVSFGYGYQLWRLAGATVWLQYSNTSAGHSLGAGSAGSIDGGWGSYTLGGRISVPVTSRLVLFGMVGGGAGSFHQYNLGADGSAKSFETWHGVAETSGGFDIRVLRHFSLRIQATDIVSGRNLSGYPGVNHFAALGGIAFHQ